MSDISKPDIDIEVNDRDFVAALFPTAIAASQLTNNRMTKHNVGLYFQDIPVNPLTGFAAYPHKHAENLGFYKIDLLSAPFPYSKITSMEELNTLLHSPIDWSWFTNVNFVATLFQFDGKINHELSVAEVVAFYAPQSIEDLACLVAIIRPGKKYLIGEPWETVRQQIYIIEDRGRQFKKSHSICYAMVVGLDARIKAPGFFSGQRSRSASCEPGANNAQQD